MELDQERLQLIRDYKMVFTTTDAGRRVLDDLKSRVVLNHTAIQLGQPIDTSWLIYYEAQRVLVLGILAKVDIDLEAKDQTVATTIVEGEL